MAKNPEKFLKRLLRDNEIRRWIQQTVLVLSLFVMLGVFWSLKLTGITMAGEAFCGKEEHTHGESCPKGMLICERLEAKPHTHSESCIAKEQICQEQEREGHTHTNACYTRPLVCTLQTQPDHTHSYLCGSLICGEPEVPGHVHTEDCFEQVQTCTQEFQPHTHTGSCFVQTQVCTLETEPHVHTGQCYEQLLICTDASPEHSHAEGCYTQNQICTQETQPHVHGEGCFSQTQVCTLETEPHTHGEGCYETRKRCSQEEMPGHTHGEGCYSLENGYLCGIHVHEDACYGPEKVKTCTLEEDPGHIHGEDCVRMGVGFGCGMAEADGHTHTLACVSGETEISCGTEASEGHTHTDSCYEKLEKCPLEEHIHDETCYSDIQADLETSDDWEMSFAHLERSVVTAENVVAIAQSQLGVAESTRNFEVDAHGVRRGITRYGQWYGNPYGDWSAMFVSFCLHYAGVEQMPANAGPESMRLEWEEAGLYVPAAEYAPRYGDVLFLHKETEMTGEAAEVSAVAEESAAETLPTEPDLEKAPPANAVAIITNFDGEFITVIEGDVEGVVAQTKYPADDPVVLGYGKVPEVSGYGVLVMPQDTARPIAATTSYDTGNFNNGYGFVLYTTVGENTYAIDGSGNAVPIYVNNGTVYTDRADTASLMWTLQSKNRAYLIRNMGTGRYLHAYSNNTGSDVTTTSEYTSQVSNSNGSMLVASNNMYAVLDMEQGRFVMTQNQAQAVRYQLGIAPIYTVWLDGTGGGQGQLYGSPNRSYAVTEGGIYTLPTQWESPVKYAQKLRGWYDVTNRVYYAPGAQVTVKGNMVLYADWTAETYDVGVYDQFVADTVSTNDFITTHLFDYNYLFNVMSANAQINVSADSHSETWRMVDGGTVDYQNRKSLEFAFVDYDGSSRLPDMGNRTGNNNYHGVGVVTTGIYTPELAQILFGTDNALNPETGEGIIGKTYVGTADHIFQYMSDPEDEYYGYYFYDSHRNAASYNQTQKRMYVYDYLEATSDSINTENPSDFLPFNSHYANTGGKTVRTYTYTDYHNKDAVHHYYDAKSADNNRDYVGTNYAFGMKMDVNFHLPNAPGERDETGETGNKDLYGRDMHFEFKGDDDVWILVDGVLVLDIGGIHGVEGGAINFATGVVTLNGEEDTKLSERVRAIAAGEHVLTLMYLERGSSQSNCAFFFNLAPRFSLSIQKEDVLTQEVLNGAEFSVFTDRACTKPAILWKNEAEHDANAPASNVFRVEKGVANMWGFASGNTYYIKETKAPDAEGYGFANGIIRLSIDKYGIATYDVEVIADGSNGISNGFTVHGIKIDEATQSAYIVATNAPEWVKEVTTVQTMKHWNDDKDHSGDYVTAYLTVTDPDGTVRRIREILLSEENDWKYTWTNLPKYAADGVTPIRFGVEEAYFPGYQGQIQQVEKFQITSETWAEAFTLENGQTYIIKSGGKFLSTTGAGADTGYKWVDEETAKSSIYALWTAHKSGSAFKLTNGANQTITFYYGNGRPTDFYASTGGESNNAKQYFKVVDANGGIRLYYDTNRTDYYLASSMNGSGKFGYTTSANSGMILVPMTKIEKEYTETVTGVGFQIENTPLEEETAVEVLKQWDNPLGNDPNYYQTEQVTIKLLADGVDTGRTVTLNLRNGWKDTFRGLPVKNSKGETIVYSIEESWITDNWVPHYGQMLAIGGQNPTYATTVTNVYRVSGPILPSTGSAARMHYILCGLGIMLSSLVYGLICRRMRERRRK